MFLQQHCARLRFPKIILAIAFLVAVYIYALLVAYPIARPLLHDAVATKYPRLVKTVTVVGNAISDSKASKSLTKINVETVDMKSAAYKLASQHWKRAAKAPKKKTLRSISVLAATFTGTSTLANLVAGTAGKCKKKVERCCLDKQLCDKVKPKSQRAKCPIKVSGCFDGARMDEAPSSLQCCATQ